MMDVQTVPRFAFGPFSMDVAERRLQRDGQDVPLTRKAFDLLLALVEGAGHLQTRDSLIEQLWPDTIVEEHSLTWNLSALRKALGDTGDAPQYIETVRGHGYRFIAQVHKLGLPEPAATVQPLSAPIDPEAAVAAPTRRPRRIARWPLLAIAAMVGLVAIGLWMRGVRQDAPAPGVATQAHSIAVLPFDNLSPDPGNAYFASGIQDTILTKLAGIGDIRVVSRTSTEAYKSHPHDIAAVAAELNVATVLEGSVQKAGSEVLINVQLIDARDGGHLWAQTYTRTLDDVFKVQSDVAGQVAVALQARLLPAEANRVASLPTEDPEAYDLFLKAEYVALQIESGNAPNPAASTEQARAYYQQAIQRDPHFALALSRLSYLESHAYWIDIDHTPARAEAGKRAADQALALDPDLPQAHLAMGYAHYYGHRDYASALGEFEHALRDLPNNADINASIANIDRRRGQWTKALAGYERAAVLDPRNPQWSILFGDTLTVMRRYDEAVRAYDRAIAVDPNDHTATIYKSLTLLMDGRPAAAAEALTTVPAGIDPGGLASTFRFEVARIGGDPSAALAVIASAPEWIEAPYTPSFTPSALLRAQAWTQLGDGARARAAFVSARDSLRKTLSEESDNPALLSLLGLAEAGLGEKDVAIEAGRRAIEKLPLERDALDGPALQAILAQIYIAVGDDAAALPLLRALLALPAGRNLSRARIEHDPQFASVRAALLVADEH
jgi:TolB-like protein/DNA-binding winged helix-turn-helix (wHTH) protein/cytochrome c-type biogenesis protein CcmH/NrfG